MSSKIILKPVFEYEGLAQYLKDVLLFRTSKNTSYSMRAFANSLEIDHSSLSRILGGKRKLSLKLVDKLSEKLALDPEETKYFKSQVIREKKGELTREELIKIEYQQLTFDTFAILQDWHYLAILQLIQLKNFRPDMTWVANVLGVSEETVEESVQRLQRIELLKIEEDGSWTDTSDGLVTTLTPGQTSAAIKKYHRQVLKKSIDALYTMGLDRRDHSAMVMAIKKQDLNEAKRRITDFRREFTKFMERHKESDEVYQLTISYFPLTDCDNLGEKPIDIDPQDDTFDGSLDE